MRKKLYAILIASIVVNSAKSAEDEDWTQPCGRGTPVSYASDTSDSGSVGSTGDAFVVREALVEEEGEHPIHPEHLLAGHIEENDDGPEPNIYDFIWDLYEGTITQEEWQIFIENPDTNLRGLFEHDNDPVITAIDVDIPVHCVTAILNQDQHTIEATDIDGNGIFHAIINCGRSFAEKEALLRGVLNTLREREDYSDLDRHVFIESRNAWGILGPTPFIRILEEYFPPAPVAMSDGERTTIAESLVGRGLEPRRLFTGDDSFASDGARTPIAESLIGEELEPRRLFTEEESSALSDMDSGSFMRDLSVGRFSDSSSVTSYVQTPPPGTAAPDCPPQHLTITPLRIYDEVEDDINFEFSPEDETRMDD